MQPQYSWTCPYHGPVYSYDGSRPTCPKCPIAHDELARAAEDAAAEQVADEARRAPPSGKLHPGAALRWLFVGWPRWILGLGMITFLISVIGIATGHGSPFGADNLLERLKLGLAGGLLFPLTGAVIYLVFKVVGFLLSRGPSSHGEAINAMNQAAADAHTRNVEEVDRLRTLTELERSGSLTVGDKLIALAAMYAFFSVSAFVMSYYGNGGHASPTGGGPSSVDVPKGGGGTGTKTTSIAKVPGTASALPGPALAAGATSSRTSTTAPTGSINARVRIAGGTFAMGAADADPDEKPVHAVTVASFELDETEITVAAYARCVQAGACTTAGLQSAPACNWQKEDRADHPINCVDWSQAKAYCEWAGARLPTEEEWEFAARGGSEQRLYPWGSAALVAQACWKPTSGGHTCPVRAFPGGVSRDGVHDLAGNVWEWTASAYCDYPDTTCNDPQRVLRGGGWGNQTATYERGSARAGKVPSERADVFGIRCAK